MHKTITTNSEIHLILKTDCSKSKKVLAYAKSISSNIKTTNISRTKSTGTIWQTILTKLDKSPKQLLDKSNPYYQENIKGRDFEDRDWTFLLMNNPDLIRGPIAIRGNKAMLIDNPTDIYKM
ncbi:glutaredoxin [Bacteroidia bacterium]|nr:glutaredoxin [Bacteroidia bacterium]MDB9881695.1 glutaredoxin [Bacteroidia bacterium]